MTPLADLQSYLEKAKAHKSTYEWVQAARCYEQALSSSSGDVLFISETWGNVGFCYMMASRQAKNRDEFVELRRSAVKAYENSADSIRDEETLENQGIKLQRKAIARFVDSWLASDPSEKRKMLDESLKLGKESLERYRGSIDELNYGKTCNELSLSYFERLYISSDWRELKRKSQEAINCCLEAINIFSRLENNVELLRAYSMASLTNWYVANFSEQEERSRKELSEKSLSYSTKALDLSRQIDDPLHSAIASWAAAFSTLIFTEKVEDSLKHAEEMLRQGTAARDNYLKGIAYYVLAFVTDWKTVREDDPDKKKEGHRKIVEFSEQAIKCLEPVCQDFFIAETLLFYAESYSTSGSDLDSTLEERKEKVLKAVEAGRKGLEHAKRSGSPDAMGSTLHALSKALQLYSNLEIDRDEKKKLLEEALAYRRDFDKVVETAYPSNEWFLGVGRNYVGLIQLDMEKLETDLNQKKALLENAAANMEASVAHCKKWIASRPVPTNVAVVASFEDSYGKILDELFQLTREEKSLTKAIEVYEDAAKQFKRINLPTRAAESYWKMAINQDRLGQHMKAAEHFGQAFSEYKEAAQRIPHFADFCLEYASYMSAWSEIERAKSAHDHENYADASGHYEKVASILKPSKRWSHLAMNFQAWSLLEKGEDLSRREQYSESIEAFNESAQLFAEAKERFEQEINKIESIDEKEKAVELGKASLQRKDYCKARTNVEEARIADRNGNHTESAEKYGLAANVFEQIQKDEVDEKDITQIRYMCRAWQKMKMADSKLSSELYSDASELFLEAKENSTKDKAALLASGNSAFCKALEHRTKYESTREKADLLSAKHYLENAADCYLKAGFESASSWTNGTEMLFDAGKYMTDAETEMNPNEKTKMYLLAEKCLERSVALFESAGYTGRRDEVMRILAKAREKRQFALSLEELLTSPSEASSTHVITPPGMKVEEPTGLLRFERAFVQANFVTHQRELVVGETFDMEIQLANLGKETAFLTGIEQLIPKEFDLVAGPERCIVVDSGLGFKGRKLAPLETTEMKLTLKSRKKGNFKLEPKIRYMDEMGEKKSIELGTANVTVKELGIRGWLRG